MGRLDFGTRWWVLVIAILVAVFGGMSYRGAMEHSPTIDEPLHALAGYYNRFEGDFRLDREDPPLWNYWAMLPQDRLVLKPNPTLADLDRTLHGYQLATGLLFQTPGNDGGVMVNRSRAMMLFAGLALAVVLACWAWQWGGAVAAVAACMLFTMDPNFLGHAPLIKNDVPMSLVIFCLAWAVWSVGRRATGWNIALLALLFGLAMVTKFSGPVAGILLAGVLIVRVFRPGLWPVLGMKIGSRLNALAAAVGMGLISLIAAWAMIWACYGFRFAPSPDPGRGLDLNGTIRLLQRNTYFLDEGHFPTDEQLAGRPLPVVGRLIRWMEGNRLLPQAWLDGFLYTYATTLARQGYLLGVVSMTGWWYYFPVAMAVKTPLATLAAFLLILVAMFASPTRAHFKGADRWMLLCVLLPIVVYGYFALTTHINLGLRHVLPIYPFCYLFIGWGISRLISTAPRRWMPVAIVLATGLAAESLSAYPHYISFFNAAARPYRLTLLSDSNFDWGQDLTYVARWQKANPDTPLYLAYWGPVDPRYYDIRATTLPGGFSRGPGPSAPDMSQPGVIMVSATLLQGVNQPQSLRDYYAPLRARNPDGMIGDSIYVFNWVPPRSP